MATFFVQQEGPVNALALNRDNTQVAIGGRNVFKVYAIEDDRFREVCNVRGSKHLNSNFSCNDVSWNPVDDHYLATATTNGHVCVWNLSKMGKAMQEQDYQDHGRTVNKVNFHAAEPNRLISGSQDGTMRYFDIRVKSAVAVFYSNTESVRDVQFSPHNPYTFSAVSDNGSVQLWDIRKSEKCMLQYTAHSGPVFACDWHPECAWLATASRDKTIKVWDLTNRPTLDYTIHTIASIGHVKWRPQRKFHITSCALVIDCSINIWDIRRPYIPFASFNEHKDIASRLAFKGDPHVFLSSGRDCTLYQHSFNDASRPASKANPQGITMNQKGEIVFARKVPVLPSSSSNNNSNTSSSLAKATVGFMRKISTSQAIDQFHLAASALTSFRLSCDVTDDTEQQFAALAKNYMLHGRSVSELCERNSAVAREFGKPHISVIWKIVKTMYGEEFRQNSSVNSTNREEVSLQSQKNSTAAGIESNLNNVRDMEADQKSKGGGDQSAQYSGGDDETENEDQVDHSSIYTNGFPTYLNFRNDLPKGDFSFGENELDMELETINSNYPSSYHRGGFNSTDCPDWILPSEAFPIRTDITDRSPQPEQFTNHHSPDISEEPHSFQVEEQGSAKLTIVKPLERQPWQPGRILVEALKHHAILGDIQTATCILIVLGDCRKCLPNELLDESLQEHWLLGYIELLTRHQLWTSATQVINLSWLSSIHQLNQQSTRISTNCAACRRPLLRVGWLCDRCHCAKYSACSVCERPVRGLYAWCQGCSHGGHPNHVKKWIKERGVCPTGCGHQCEYR
ncbi:unnamed protein product [Acanthoscelides obtectus]|uniref:GATOR2 complex protein WDR24 n=1 Tax=Acanthoscelides obtectus TaxID=200917 RepID=A0A9P0PKW6_ACAOB|nr:unnamed protein product [Acanthoscelides obtectus]CAK1622203.1 GATOR complex protein WDR24 [Acanthoscelides obtectus]